MKACIKMEKIIKKNLIKNQYTLKNIYKLKQNPIMEKSTQISTAIKYQKKILNIFAYQ